MNKSNHPVQGLAEISLRVHDLVAMRRFYKEVIGFEAFREICESEGVFLRHQSRGEAQALNFAKIKRLRSLFA